MERITRVRIGIILLVFCLILGFFSFKLYSMQIIETGGKVDNTKIFVTETRVKAARGDILDRNGNILVTNRASYDLVLNHYIIYSAQNTRRWIWCGVWLFPSAVRKWPFIPEMMTILWSTF